MADAHAPPYPMRLARSSLSLNTWLLFFLICTLYLMFSLISNELILTEEVYYRS